MSEFTLIGLRVVREVVERGSFSAAASRLGYTQSAVSRQIALAEAVAGRPLFERHARGVQPTDTGRLLARHADAVLAELAAARRGIDDLGAQPHGLLRVGSFSTAMAVLVPRTLAAFTPLHPRVRIVLREGLSATHIKRVATGKLDIAVTTGTNQPPDGVIRTALMDDPLLLAVHRHHRLADSPSVNPDELVDERWVVGSAEPVSHLLGPWTGESWTPEIAYVARDWTAKLGLVAAGLGTTVVPGLAVSALPSSIAVVRIDHPAATRTIAIATSRTNDAGVEAFSEALRDTAAEVGTDIRRQLRPQGVSPK